MDDTTRGEGASMEFKVGQTYKLNKDSGLSSWVEIVKIKNLEERYESGIVVRDRTGRTYAVSPYWLAVSIERSGVIETW